MASAPAPGCPVAPVTNPFTPWGDSADYQLAPGGDVEDAGASWALTGGAAAQEGNETAMTSATGHLSMRLPASSSATTGSMCIGLEHPTFRFFAKRSGGSLLSRLLVEVVFDDASGHEWTVPVGLVSASGTWAPTASLPMIVNLLAPLHGNALDVAFRFEPQGSGTWSVDDVFVDPHRII